MRTALLALVLLAAAPALAKPPIWDRVIDSPKRFKVLKEFQSLAVLDQETGLVWMATAQLDELSLAEAVGECVDLVLGGRGGWRLPTVHEMRSLVPPDAQALPAGHPFTAPDGFYWTSTPATVENFWWVGDLGNPKSTTAALDSTSDYAGFWCVRGGLGGSTD
jgi:hypothetical protein